MNQIILAGAPGQGKSEFIKNAIQGKRCLIFDFQNEYGQRTKYVGQTALNLSDNVKNERARYTGGKVKEFIDIVKTKRNTICVFEEATAFLEGKTKEEIREIMISRKHTGNTLIFVFHSINACPPRIVELSDYFVMYRTNDNFKIVKNKYPYLLSFFSKLRHSKNQKNIIIKLV